MCRASSEQGRYCCFTLCAQISVVPRTEVQTVNSSPKSQAVEKKDEAALVPVQSGARHAADDHFISKYAQLAVQSCEAIAHSVGT